MGWSLGEVSGREVGYSVDAECDAEGCTAEIDRGVSYACGETHGWVTPDADGNGGSCEGYFCEKHQAHHTADGEPCPHVVEMSKPWEGVTHGTRPR